MMRLHPKTKPGQTQLLLLAPRYADIPPAFENVQWDRSRHERLLGGLQRLRGSVYLQDGAIERRELSDDGRHCLAIDQDSWHLLTVDDSGAVGACVRYRVHPNTTSFRDLWVRHSALAASPVWGGQFRSAIESELSQARHQNISYAEVGGWALAPARRCTTEALRIALSTYSLAQTLGGCIGITMATLRHCSSSILRRIGGRPLQSAAAELPAYYDPKFECQMEVLRFESANPASKYVHLVKRLGLEILGVPVICPSPGRTFWPAVPEYQTAATRGTPPFATWQPA